MTPRARTSLQLTPALSLRWIVELRSERRFAPDGSITSRERTLPNDLLGTYFVRPGTVLYLGYGALREGPAWEDLRVARNTVFLKVSYMFQT